MTSGTVITLRIGQSAGKVSKSVEGNFVWLGYGTPSTTERLKMNNRKRMK